MFEWIEEVNINFNEKDFEQLKNHFKGDINSNRRFEEITTVDELVNVLEDRDVLTDDILVKCEPNFRNFVKARRKSRTDFKKLTIPENVVNWITEGFRDNWESLGIHLKLTDDQLKQSQNIQHVLSYYAGNCEGISHQEMIFRLNRGLEKCEKLNQKNTIVKN